MLRGAIDALQANIGERKRETDKQTKIEREIDREREREIKIDK